MSCNCTKDNAVIEFIRETSAYIRFVFNVEDLSSFEGVKFTIRKDYKTNPILEKTITNLADNSVLVELTPAETALFTEFQNGKNSAQYIWGLDLILDSTNPKAIINIFPKTGMPAPLCIVYKNVVEEV
jgi:hypothetical protein